MNTNTPADGEGLFHGEIDDGTPDGGSFVVRAKTLDDLAAAIMFARQHRFGILTLTGEHGDDVILDANRIVWAKKWKQTEPTFVTVRGT